MSEDGVRADTGYVESPEKAAAWAAFAEAERAKAAAADKAAADWKAAVARGPWPKYEQERPSCPCCFGYISVGHRRRVRGVWWCQSCGDAANARSAASARGGGRKAAPRQRIACEEPASAESRRTVDGLTYEDWRRAHPAVREAPGYYTHPMVPGQAFTKAGSATRHAFEVCMARVRIAAAGLSGVRIAVEPIDPIAEGAVEHELQAAELEAAIEELEPPTQRGYERRLPRDRAADRKEDLS